MTKNVAVLGVSNNPERYAYQAVKLLAEMDYAVFPVHPSARPIDDIYCYPKLAEISEPLDTVSIYLSEKNSTPLINEIISSAPRRIILNPGAENAALKSKCIDAGIQVIEACTLVMLRTGQF